MSVPVRQRAEARIARRSRRGAAIVSIAGITLMTIVAYYISWSKRQDKPLPKTPAKPKAG